MIEITADEELEHRLRGFLQPVEIRDERGKILGTFFPTVSEAEKAAYARMYEVFDLEEAKKAAAVPGKGRTIKEILADLHAAEQTKECAAP